MNARLNVVAILLIVSVYPAGTDVVEARQTSIGVFTPSNDAASPTRAEVHFLMLYNRSAEYVSASLRTVCKNSNRQALVCGSSMFVGGVGALAWGLWKMDFFSLWVPYEGPPGIYVTAGVMLAGMVASVWGVHLIRYALDYPPERFGRRAL